MRVLLLTFEKKNKKEKQDITVEVILNRGKVKEAKQ